MTMGRGRRRGRETRGDGEKKEEKETNMAFRTLLVVDMICVSSPGYERDVLFVPCFELLKKYGMILVLQPEGERVVIV